MKGGDNDPDDDDFDPMEESRGSRGKRGRPRKRQSPKKWPDLTPSCICCNVVCISYKSDISYDFVAIKYKFPTIAIS